jgi:hypothetical protein
MVDDVDVWVVGVRKGVPSNAAAIHINRSVQEELYGIPFTNSIAPNWTAWSAEDGDTKVELATTEGLTNSKGNRYNGIKKSGEKPYQQIIRTAREGGTGGVARTFLGLTRGHAYRISVRMNTIAKVPRAVEWSYTLHFACGSAETKLSPRQMAGLETLPDGTKGPAAGRVAGYTQAITSRGKYQEQAKEVVLPEGADAITIWLRFTSGKRGDAVAVDYVKLEDLGKQ